MQAPNIPPYLQLLEKQLPGQPSTQPTRYINATFRHVRPLPSVSHALWWRGQNCNSVCLVFITGNPGLLDFYTPFLEALYEKAGGKLDIFGHALVGHTPGIRSTTPDLKSTCLSAQVESALEVIDAVKSHHEKVVVAGHSVGAWIALQTLKIQPESVNSAFLLFPTICHIADTPNGRSYSKFFTSPLSRLVSWLSVCTRLIPSQLLSTLLFPDWPQAQLQVLRTFLNSPSAIYAAMNMAHEEMETIKELDTHLLNTFSQRIYMYFGEIDNWVGKNKDAILRGFAADEDHVQIVHGHKDIPHAFCINHGEHVASQCYKWLDHAGYLQ